MVGLSSDADWQTNFFDDQYWVRAGDDGTFSISGVRPGAYTLHVYSEGQIGEASLGGIRLEAGQKFDLGNVGWKPQNYGQFVWQLGYPDRSAAKFGHGEDATRWGDWILKPKEFPAVVNYIVGKSDPKKDWNFAVTQFGVDGSFFAGVCSKVRRGIFICDAGGWKRGCAVESDSKRGDEFRGLVMTQIRRWVGGEVWLVMILRMTRCAFIEKQFIQPGCRMPYWG